MTRLTTLLLIAALCCAGQTPKKPVKKRRASHAASKFMGPKSAAKSGAKSTSTARTRKSAKRATPVKPLPPPEPIHVAIENSNVALTSFYQALSDKTGVVRILHFGDSHIAADILTRVLRDEFQSRFGDAGAGLVLPGAVFRGYRREGVAVKALPKNWLPLTLRNPPDDGLLGLPGAALGARSVAGAALATSRFSSFELQMAGEVGDEPCVEISVDDATVETTRQQISGPYGTLAILANRDPLPLDTHTLSVTQCGGAPRIVGLDLRTGTPGVIYDTFGINGAQFLDIEKMSAPLRHDLIARLNPTLIIVSYGTNEMGRKGLDAASYQAETVRLLKALQADAPGVPVLVTGPFDRPGRTTKSRDYFRERSDMVIAALRASAVETGCAFWDARAAMGGFGAMLRWRRSSMAQPDLVHLTGTGYNFIAKMFFEEILAAAPAVAP